MSNIEVSFNPVDGIVHCKLTGFFHISDMQIYQERLSSASAIARRKSKRLLMLYDSSECLVQSSDVIAKMREIGSNIRRPGDRLAVLVASSLIKMQAQRSFVNSDEKAFISKAAAETWLRAYQPSDEIT